MAALRILVVEDDDMVAMLLTEVLAEMGHEVCAIEATEAAAVAAARRCRPDLMIVDAQLAAGNGIAAVAEILGAGFIPHLFISGDVARVAALRPGAVTIQKPFRVSALARAIERALAAPPAA